MSLLKKLQTIIEEGRMEYEGEIAGDFQTIFKGKDDVNILAQGENLKFMKYLLENKKMESSLQTIYLDPPFFSKANYDAVVNLKSEKGKELGKFKILAYEDKWEKGIEEYLRMLCARLFMIHRLLKEDGTIWLHLDWHIVHYVKIIMDEIFGEKNFINEIIWTYKSGGTSKKHFSRKHDTILLYGKSKKYKLNIGKEKSYNRGYKPYRFKGVEEFQDDLGWYTMVNQKDIWPIDMVGRTSKERTGYATQKPLALMKRIIESSTDEGDLCGDFFCGSSGFSAAAEELNRNWIGADLSPLSISMSESRLDELKADFSFLKEKSIEETKTGDFNIVDGAPENYSIDIKKIPIEEKEKLELKEIIDYNKDILINYWKIEKRENNRSVIRVVDVFGNTTEKELL